MGATGKARRVLARSGHVVQQVFEQLVIRRGSQHFGSVGEQLFEFPVQLPQQVFDRDTGLDGIHLQRFHQRQTDMPERLAGGPPGQLVQPLKHLFQVSQIFIRIDAPDKPRGRILIHLAQFAHGIFELGVVGQQRQALAGHFPGGAKIGAEQFGLGQQAFAPHRA